MSVFQMVCIGIIVVALLVAGIFAFRAAILVEVLKFLGVWVLSVAMVIGIALVFMGAFGGVWW